MSPSPRRGMLTQSRKGMKECKAWRSRKTTPPPIRFRNIYLPGAIDCHSGTYVEYRNTLLQGLACFEPVPGAPLVPRFTVSPARRPPLIPPPPRRASTFRAFNPPQSALKLVPFSCDRSFLLIGFNEQDRFRCSSFMASSPLPKPAVVNVRLSSGSRP